MAKLVRRAPGASLASVAVALVAMGTLTLDVSPALPTTISRSRPSITPHLGKPFVPRLGNWEGTVNGFPASFELLYNPNQARLPYEFHNLVALRPSACPPAAYRYAEDLIATGPPVPIGRTGSLPPLGYDGGLTGARSATLTTHYRVAGGACAGTLAWHLQPTARRRVPDGLWTLRFADGESGRFQVQGGGRLATGIGLPAELTRCNGVSGAVDLFIAVNGVAGSMQPDVRLSIRFSGRRANGQLNGGRGGCARGPFRFGATLERRSGAAARLAAPGKVRVTFHRVSSHQLAPHRDGAPGPGRSPPGSS